MEYPKTAVKRKPTKCTNCNSENIARILYGMPDFNESMEKDIAEKKIVLGGCVIFDHAANWKCTDCETYYYRSS